MKKLFKISFIFSILAIALAINVTPVQAQGDDTFELSVKHNINGRSLGLDKALMVDVYANGVKAFTFSFGQTVETSLPAGNYFIEVKLNPSFPGDDNVMTLGPVDIPAGVTVDIRAQLSGGKTPALKVNIK
jgi:hypothetical protein